MRRCALALIACLVLGSAAPAAGSPSQGKDKKPKHGQNTRGDSRVGIHVVFSAGEVAILRSHYAPRYRNLPPGLQKKVARGLPLPPGWQKKLEPFPPGIERRLETLPHGYGRGVIDGHGVIYNSRSGVVIDMTVLF